MIRLIAPSALAALLLVSCGRPSPVVTFHTLTPLTEPAGKAEAVSLEILPVDVPELLQRTQIVLLQGKGTHRIAPSHRWGNTLEKDIQRVLAENITTLTGSDAISLYPEGQAAKARYRLQLHVTQCDGDLGGSLRFRGTWLLIEFATGKTVRLKRVQLEEPIQGQSIDDLVAAHDRVLDQLSRDIVTVLGTLMNAPT